MKANPKFAFGAIPEGLFEICFAPKREMHFYRKEGSKYVPDSRSLGLMEEREYNILFSLMIDERIT